MWLPGVEESTWRRVSSAIARRDTRHNRACCSVMFNGLTKVCAWVTGESLGASWTPPGLQSCVVAKVGQGGEGWVGIVTLISRSDRYEICSFNSTTN